MPLSLFGFELKRKKDEKEVEQKLSPILTPSTANDDDGGTTVMSCGHYGHYIDLDGQLGEQDDAALILTYRAAAENPECDLAIENIVNEAISFDEGKCPVYLNLDDLDQPDEVKELIMNEFDTIVNLLNFNNNSTDIFKRWYIDGRLYYHIIINEKNHKDGIRELRPIDATKIRKIREVIEKYDEKTKVKIIDRVDEYFLFQQYGNGVTDGNSSGLKITTDSICYVPSGYMNQARKRVISPLQKAVKPVNQLRMMEDALVMYRVARAPERRIFYIDVGNLPKGKAEEYLQSVMSKYRNKIVYDATTGEIRDDRKHMAMLEDFWLPRREGGKGTEITTLPGGENLGQIDDILFFQKKLFRSLNVPLSRLETDTGFSLGRTTEITRDELNFQKFIFKLRRKFAVLFLELLKKQLILKGVVSETDWNKIKDSIWVDFIKDSYFTELKNLEILGERINMLSSVDTYVGKYYSTAWVRKNILNQTKEEIDEMMQEMDAEKEAAPPPEDDVGY
jgi:hypothetical protein